MMPFIAKNYFRSLRSAEQERLLRDNLPLGEHPETGDIFWIKEADRYSGTYVIGKAGRGKSGLLEGMIYEDAHKGNAIIVIDPHGDLVNHVLEALPPQRLPHTYVLDILDEEHPFGVNLFSHSKPWRDMKGSERSALVERTKHVVRVLFGEEVTKQAHLSRFLTNATILLLSNPGTTFYDMLRLFRDTPYRQKLYATLDDDDVRNFWHDEFEALTEAKRKQITDPLMGRLQQIFVGHPITKHILSQRKTTINFRRAIEHREIILMKLPINGLQQDAEVIGRVLVAQISEALFSFANLPDEQRPSFSLYIDEFEHYVSSDIKKFISEGRKYGIKLTMAHQVRSQLKDEELQSATLGTQTQIVFQPTIEDAPELARLFPAPEQSIDPDSIETKPADYLLARGSTVPVIDTFIKTYLLPLQGFRRGHVVEIRHGGMDIFGGLVEMSAAMQGMSKSEPVRVDDPLPYLNRLLHDVMVRGNPRLPIPPEIPRGFANSGRGFFAAVRNVWHSPVLQPDFVFRPIWSAGEVGGVLPRARKSSSTTSSSTYAS